MRQHNVSPSELGWANELGLALPRTGGCYVLAVLSSVRAASAEVRST
jgi:hypothetical protein